MPLVKPGKIAVAKRTKKRFYEEEDNDSYSEISLSISPSRGREDISGHPPTVGKASHSLETTWIELIQENGQAAFLVLRDSTMREPY
jgi:hypothetical protein